MLLLVLIGVLAWLGVSIVVAPVVGMALRRLDTLERARSVAVLHARAEHPASRHAA